MCEDVAGLLRDKTRKPELPPLLPALIERVVELTLGEPSGRLGDALDRPSDGGGHRGVVAFGTADLGGARACSGTECGVSCCHRIRPLPPSCAGLYLDHRLRTWCRRSTRDRKSRRSTALSRACRSRRGAADTMIHDYFRHGTTTLFAALVLDRTVVGRYCRASAPRIYSFFEPSWPLCPSAGDPRDARQLRRRQAS
jgi:hypothetical protein